MTASTRDRRPPVDDRAPAVPAPADKTRPGQDRAPARPATPAVREIGGPKGPEPTRYGDWEKGGRCIDF